MTYRNANRPSPDSVGSALTDGEFALLVDGLTDDISFDIALINLGIRRNPPARNEPPEAVEVEAAFRSYERLLDAGLIRLAEFSTSTEARRAESHRSNTWRAPCPGPRPSRRGLSHVERLGRLGLQLLVRQYL